MSLCGSICFGSADKRAASPDVLVAVLKLTKAQAARPARIDIATDEMEVLPDTSDFSAAGSMLAKGKRLEIMCFRDAWGLKMLAEVETQIPPEIRGDFRPAQLDIGVGENREVVEEMDCEQLRDVGVLYLRVSIFGYGFPRDTRRFAELVFRLPSFQDFEKLLSEIVGPVIKFTSFSS